MDGSGNSLGAGPDGRKRRVVYYYDDNIGNYYYGADHFMKPHRIRMTHSLVEKYELHRRMEVVTPPRASFAQLTVFHHPEYVAFLKSVRPDTQHLQQTTLKLFNLHGRRENPVFDDLYSYCEVSAGGSIAGAVTLNKGDADIAINWAGGLHHAKSCLASGFCYVNDVVLAILELLKHHGRVLYIDIDIHHGDGVEEAFYTDDRVMTVSFHQFGNHDGKTFFPGTGDLKEIGKDRGKYYSVNVPLFSGVDDESYQSLFKPIISKVMEVFQPGAVVLQCGADSLYGDRLGFFNLSVKGHGECVKFLRSFNVPLLLLGGGGYTLRNVARCWCYETAVAVGLELDDTLPEHDYIGYYGPEYSLHSQMSGTMIMKNNNTRTYVDSIREDVLRNLSEIVPAPSVQYSEKPSDADLGDEDEEDNLDVCKEDPDAVHDWPKQRCSPSSISEPAYPSTRLLMSSDDEPSPDHTDLVVRSSEQDEDLDSRTDDSTNAEPTYSSASEPTSISDHEWVPNLADLRNDSSTPTSHRRS